VGVLVIIKYQNNVLLGKRKGSHGEGEWSFPGGHLELNESIEECGRREVFEETGIDLYTMSPSFKGHTNDIFVTEKKHYITLYNEYVLDTLQTPILKEPEKCFEWKWFNVNKLPTPLFLCVTNYSLHTTI
jgi:8-oxo-dGTP diphosphatase